MQAYHLDHIGTLDGLTLRDSAVPRPGPRQVLVRVHARSLNYRDLFILHGRYPVPARPGVIALSDGAGEVAEIGAGVQRVAVGDKVVASYFPLWRAGAFTMEYAAEQYGCTLDGMLAECVLVDEAALVKTPAHLSYEEAACLPCAAVTAWSALNGARRVLPGETVLTIGSGAVALFAMQFALLAGARVIGVTSNQHKAALMKQLGAHDVVNYNDVPEWDKQVRHLTGGKGIDHIVESGSITTLPRSIGSAAVDCQLTLIAPLAASAKEGDAIDPRLFGGLLSIRRVFVGSRSAFEDMNRAIALHRLRPVIDSVHPFADARAAYAYAGERRHTGKIVIADQGA